LRVAVASLVAVAVGPISIAMAEPPNVAIESPTNGSVSNNQTPSFSGVTDDALTNVTVNIYAGSTVGETPLQMLSTLVPPLEGKWSVGPAETLADGEYTAQATQTNLALENGHSAPVTFTVNTSSPTVTLSQPKSPSNDTTPSFTGFASDTTQVTVKIYKGAKAQGTVVSSATAPSNGGEWSSTEASPALSSGEYTAQATQPSSLGNPAGKSNTVTFTLDTSSPTVTLSQPKSPSNDTTPSFTGFASDTTQVTVKIYKGAKAEGTVVSSATATGNGGEWSSTEAGPALSSGEYTAQATQPSSLGNAAGKSNTVTFTVETAAPTVTLKQPKSPSNDATPAFTGTASDTEPVTVKIYKGAKAEGTVVSSATATGNGGDWSSTEASPALSSGEYTAQATQPSSLGNAAGKSNTVTFTVETASPKVTLDQPPSPSNDTKPSFTGTASDSAQVTVHIYDASNSEVSSATAKPSGGSWTSGKASPALSSGEYTAIATEPSSLGNPAGTSNTVTFTVNTSAPTVTLNPPKSPSNDTTPSFTGTASDTEPVTVKIYKGAKAQGTVVSSATAPGNGGEWSSTEASPALSSGEYTAQATQPSSIGNPAGKSNAVTFVVETAAPTVTLTQPKSPSNDTTPSFTGFASDTTTVTVKIYKGTKAEGTAVSSATAPGNGGEWSSTEASPALSSGEYTAQATQPSSLGNPAGKSNAVTFVVETAAPTVTLTQPKSPSNETTPSFTGTASDTTTVTVKIYKGTKAEGTVVSSAAATGTGGAWSSGQASPALSSGQYTAIATQPSSLGNSPGSSSPVTFIVDTSSPTVTLNRPKSPSNNTAPSFTGTASATTQVTVQIYEGTKAEGTEVSTATATGTGGSWTSAGAKPALSAGTHTYTAVAVQASPLGNPAGRSEPVTFTVDTAAPIVTLNSPAVRSNDTTPSFTGTASDTTQVTVKIYAGPKAEGSAVRTLTAQGTGGNWTSEAVSPALSNGEYTAIATQPSSLGNPAGTSRPVTFTVDTTSPTVTLNQPQSPSNTTKPTFTGTASDIQPVTVNIYKGTKAEGTAVSSATAPGTGGGWSSGEASPALLSGTYTATATQPSSLKNAPGTSAPMTFTVNTAAPTVTLNLPKSPSNNTAPSFTGTASDTTQVAVTIYEGPKAEGTVLSSATATGTGGAWTSGNATPALPGGKRTYTAVATQESSLGNPAGKSSAVTFIVDTTSPTVTLNQPKSPSNNTAPSFTGTASATTAVTIQIYEGTKAEGTAVSSATATGTGGGWTSASAKPALSTGMHTYTAVAIEASPLGNPPGRSEPVTFTVNTSPPTVTLNSPPSRSNNVTPSFTGTASDTTQVTIQIYEGTKAEGTEVSTAKATGTGSSWTSGVAEPALPNGKHTFTAIATQKSSLGNPAGISNSVTFTVDTSAPTVTLSSPPSRSNDTMPSFSGTASEKSPVTIQIHAGPAATGPLVSTAEATGTGGGWTSGKATPALSDGQYTAVASQQSSFGNHVGESAPVTFAVDTVLPQITLTEPANGSSTGSGSQLVRGSAGTLEHDLPSVTVQLFSGSAIIGGQTTLQSITYNAVGGAWSVTFAGLSPGTYTVRALQSDDAGNVGVSPTSTFVVVGSSSAAAAHQPAPPAASFSWFPSTPRIGESVSLVSTSTDATSPITAFAWDLKGSGAFAPGAQAISTSFSTPGHHVVQLRVTDANGLSSVAAETIAVSSPRLMQPFPIVRIAGSATRSGVKLRLLSVVAPAGARITVKCRGHGCPVKSQSRLAAVGKVGASPVEFRRFERSLGGGVILEIRVSKSGEIGKYTRFAVRRGKLPARLDRCLDPAGIRPMVCPSS
jgi:large repetitive protein